MVNIPTVLWEEKDLTVPSLMYRVVHVSRHINVLLCFMMILLLITSIPLFNEGCPILRQIYAWHCIVLTLDNNTVQKHNNKA